MSENFTVQYPILAYKSNAPTDNEIFIVNLIQNIPQKLVNISPFRFIQFVETGLVPEKLLYSKKANNTSVWLLVEKDSKLYLMYYRCCPWPFEQRHIKLHQKDRFELRDKLVLVTGFIDLEKNKKNIDPTRLTAEKI